MALKQRKSRVAPPPCPLASCMTYLKGAWTPNVIWYLSAAPRRFGELKADIGGISAKTLSARLQDLEAKGVVSRTLVPTSPPSAEYALTPFGRELLPAIEAIAAVGHRLHQQTRRRA